VRGESRRNFREHLIEWDAEKIARLWDFYARHDSHFVYFSKAFGDQLLRFSKLPLSEPLRVLDFGCGPGFIWDHILEVGARWNYTGLDFSRRSVEQLRTKAAEHPQFGSALHVEQLPAPLPSDHFDAALLFEVVEHLDDHSLSETLVEIRRTLRANGTLVVSTPNEEDLAASTKFCPDCGAVFHEWQHVRRWSAKSLQDRLGAEGFALVRSQALDFRARGPLRQIVRATRRVVLGQVPNPHLLAIFRKDGV
jgi:SAM-dependent methyltransferase